MEERLVDELIELSERIARLSIFIRRDEFKTMTKDKQHILKEQFEYMQGYRVCLMHRIVDFMKE